MRCMKKTRCIALGWRFVNWPLPITATRTTTRSENRTRGSRDQRNHQGGGTRAQGVSSQYKGPQPFFQERQVRRNRVQPPSTSSPPFRAAWAGTHYPPPQSYPFPKKTITRIDLSENLVSASKSGSEVTVRAQDDRMKHFWLNDISLRGQTAELETSAC
jgi:hypothetical protein